MLFLLGAGCLSQRQDSVALPVESPVSFQQEQESVAVAFAANAQDVVETGDEIGPSVDGKLLAAPEPLFVSMRVGSYYFEPRTIVARPGQQVYLQFDQGDGDDTFIIDALHIRATTGARNVVSFTAPHTPGKWVFYSDVGSHRALGMEGVLVVE
jgi:plastocyanin